MRHEIRVPELGVAESRLSVGLWLVPRGGLVREDEPLVEILAGEALVDIASPWEGKLSEIRVGEDQPTRTGDVLGIVVSED